MRALAILVALLACTAPAVAADLPDPSLTPGATLSLDTEQVCAPGRTKAPRHLAGSTKAAVLKAYGITRPGLDEFEIDRLIPSGIGGSNDPGNLWPLSRTTQPWNADKKKKLDHRLRKLVCKGELRLAEAQRDVAANWIEAYHKYVEMFPYLRGDLAGHARRDRSSVK